MFLITYITNSGHVKINRISPLDRREVELLLTERGWRCDDYAEREIWRKEGVSHIIKLEKVLPLPPTELSREIAEFEKG